MTKMSFRPPILFVSTIVVLLFIYAIDAYSYDTVKIDEETIALHSLQTIFAKDIDSEQLKRVRTSMTSDQDATMIVMDIRRNWDKWSPEFREMAGGYFLAKPPLTLTLSPEGRGEDMTMSKVANLSARKAVLGGQHLLPNWIETTNFSIEWGNNITSTDSGTDSAEIVACSKGPPCDKIPDVVDRWADYFEEVWTREIETLGYIRPTGTGAYLYDIYIANTQDNIVGNNDDQTPTLGYDFLGLTATYCNSGTLNSALFCENKVSSSYSYIIVNNYFQDSDIMTITAAHEFFHAIQFSYPTIDNWFSLENHWWIEATATWMEEVVYDDANSYYPRIISWLKAPSLSLKNSGNHEYGDALFIIFLTDIYLKDQDFVKYVWENMDGGVKAMDNVLTSIYKKGSFDSAFKEFVALNAVADIGYTKGGYEEGPQYGRAAVTKIHSQYPPPYSTVSGDLAPQELGSNYIQFLPSDNYDNRLVIEFDGEDGTNWGTMVVKVRSDGTGFESEEIVLNPQTNYGCHPVEGFGTTYNEIFLVAAVLVDPDVTGSVPYTYRATLNSTCNSVTNVYLTQPDSQGESSNINQSRDRCFIATAAFGSANSPYVRILRDFRDKYLIPYDVGKRFVRLYYALSPSIADFIGQHPPAAFMVRIALLPAISIALFFLKTTLLEKMVLVIFTLSLSLLYIARRACPQN